MEEQPYVTAAEADAMLAHAARSHPREVHLSEDDSAYILIDAINGPIRITRDTNAIYYGAGWCLGAFPHLYDRATFAPITPQEHQSDV